MTTWQLRVRELQALGMTLQQIGAAVGLSTPAIGGIATGRTKQPRGEAAVRLDKLHRRLTRKNSAA
jgi:transcriptional regulator with XRE-family HTH domain